MRNGDAGIAGIAGVITPYLYAWSEIPITSYLVSLHASTGTGETFPPIPRNPLMDMQLEERQ
jgi:hypothetical protein